MASKGALGSLDTAHTEFSERAEVMFGHHRQAATLVDGKVDIRTFTMAPKLSGA